LEEWNNGKELNTLFHHSIIPVFRSWGILLPPKAVLANYIVRIYRFEKNKPHNLVGVVEEAGGSGKRAFTSLNELWDIIISSKSVRNYRKTDEKKRILSKK